MNTTGKSNRILSLFLAFVLVIGMVAVFPMPASAATPVSLAEWKLSSSPASATSYLATGGTAANASATISLSSNATITGVGNGTSSPYSYTYNAWQSGNLSWQLSGISTAGYDNITLAFAVQSSNTGPANFALQYSIDGGSTWLTLSDSSNTPITYTAANSNGPKGPFVLTSAVNDCASLSIRFSNTDTTSVNGTTTASGGTSRINNIVVSGTLSSGSTDPQAAAPAADPNPTAGAVAEGTQVTLSSATAGAAIYYTTDGTAPTSSSAQYTAPIALNFGSNSSVTITAYASASGYADSAPVTFTYTKDYGTVSIAQAFDMAASSHVVVEGIVMGTYAGSNYKSLFIQDGTSDKDGICVYKGATDLSGYLGQKIRVSGTRADYNGLKELTPDATNGITVLDAAPVLYQPVSVSVADLAAKKYQSMCVGVTNVQLTSIGTASGTPTSALNTIKSASGDTVTMRTAPEAPAKFAVNDWITVNKGFGYSSGSAQNAWYVVNDTSDTNMLKGTDPTQTDTPVTDGSGCLASWKFNTSMSVPAIANGGDLSGTADLQVIKNGSAPSPSATLSGTYITYNSWSGSTNEVYWLAKLSSKGSANISVIFDTYSSATGPRDFKLQFSADNGTTWQDAVSPDYTSGNAAWVNSIAKTLPAAANDQASLWIRWIKTSEVSANGGTLGSTGTNRLSNVYINCDYILQTGQLCRPVSDTPSGPVALGQTINFTPNVKDAGVAGYKVMLSTDGNNWSAATGNAFTLTSLPYTLYVKAAASGYIDSRVDVYSFSQATTKTPIASPVPGSYVALSKVTLASDDGAEIWYTTDESKPEKGEGTSVKYDSATGITGLTLPVTIKAIAYKTGCIDSEVGTYAYTKASTDTDYNCYFGQLHSHTTLSDGAGTVEEAFAHAKDVRGLDFLAVTDHSNSFPMALSSGGANINDPKSDTSFLRGRAAAAAVTDSTFVGIYGYEMTWSGSTGGFGHINTFDTAGFESRNNSYFTANTTDPATNGLYRYYQNLKTATGTQDGGTPISQLNHPGTTFGDFLDFKFYDPTLDPYVQLVEVGNGEGAIGSGGYFASYDYYTRALDQGWHVAPSNNQDNHKGNWGDSNTARTVVLAKQLTMTDIFDAIRNRRVYATEDETLKINYTLAGMEMGYIFPDGTAPTGTVPIHVTLTTPDASRIAGGTVSVVTDFGVIPVSVTIADNPTNGATQTTAEDGTATFDWTVDVPATSSYYYIQVIENRSPAGSTWKYRAVTAPVWIGTTTKAGIRATTCSDLVPLGGVQTTISSTLYNNESGTLTVNSLTYTLANGTVINTSTAPITILSGGTYTYSFPYTPSLGTQVINVTAACDLGGTAKTFADTLTIKAGDPTVMTFIGIDASKYGEYVAGNYANCYNNFLKVTTANNVVVKILNTITPDTLKGCAAVIIPTPARKSGTNTPKDGSPAINYTAQEYTTEELQAYADFAAQGGSFIIAGISDYGDGTAGGPYHASTQLNAVLQSIGADSRISDDEVVDFDSNLSSTSYRLAFDYSEMNPDSQYTAGVTSNQTYSFYSGCSVIPGTTDKTEWIVKGHSTTFSIDADGDTGPKTSASTKPSGDLSQTDLTRGIVVGQGNVYALVAEQLPGGGKAFIGGSTFFSDFEISDFDAGNNLALSNMMVTWNIIKSLVKPTPTSSISVARAAEIGRVFKVQGTVASCTNGSDATHGFFDCMYIQDATGGINVFGITSDMRIPVGTKVTVTGTVQEYNGDIELKITDSSSVVADGTDTEPAPLALSTTAARDLTTNGGWLAKIQGTVTKLTKTSGLLSAVWVKDANDTSEFGTRLFIDGYIGGTEPTLAVGDTVSGIGFVSASDDGLRLRVRDRAEIVKLSGGSTVDYSTPSYYADISGAGAPGSLLVSVDQITGRASVKIDPLQGNPLSGGKNVTVKLPTIPNVSTYSLNIQSDALSSSGSGSLTLSTDAGDLTLPSDMLSNTSGTSGKDAQITIGKADKSVLSASAQAQIGDRPVITLSLTLGGQQTEWNNPDAPVTVSIPYTPTAAELVNPDGIVLWYIDGSGNLVSIPNGHYDPSTGTMTFKTTHFSFYAVGYHSASFNDVTADAWYFKPVSFITARSITTGTGNGNFSPAINLTRADFLVMLMKAYSIAPDTNPADNFSDAGSTYYTGYLAAAKRLGISNGVGNNMFTPESKITRQEMFTLLYNALKVIGQLPQGSSGKTLSDFSDAGNIASWAQEAMTRLVQTGTISGSDGKLTPTGATTRAEMAQVLYNLLSK